MTRKGIRSLGGDVHKYIPPRTLCWQSRPAIFRINNNTPPITPLHSLSVATFILFLDLIVFTLSSGVIRKPSINPKIRCGGREEKNFSASRTIWGEAQQLEEGDLVRDTVETLSFADGVQQNLPTGVMGVSADTPLAFMVSDNQNININININDGSSNIAAEDSNNIMTTTE